MSIILRLARVTLIPASAITGVVLVEAWMQDAVVHACICTSALIALAIAAYNAE